MVVSLGKVLLACVPMSFVAWTLYQLLQQHLGGDSGNWPKPSRYTVHRHWPGLVAFFHDGRPPTVVEGGLARYLAPTCTRAPGGYKRRDVRLDATEGLPWWRYRPLWLEAEDITGNLLRAVTYIAQGNKDDSRPSLRYLTLLREGARAHGLPEHYIRFLEQVEHAR